MKLHRIAEDDDLNDALSGDEPVSDEDVFGDPESLMVYVNPKPKQMWRELSFNVEYAMKEVAIEMIKEGYPLTAVKFKERKHRWGSTPNSVMGTDVEAIESKYDYSRFEKCEVFITLQEDIIGPEDQAKAEAVGKEFEKRLSDKVMEVSLADLFSIESGQY